MLNMGCLTINCAANIINTFSSFNTDSIFSVSTASTSLTVNIPQLNILLNKLSKQDLNSGNKKIHPFDLSMLYCSSTSVTKSSHSLY